jgi:hypothetical protein
MDRLVSGLKGAANVPLKVGACAALVGAKLAIGSLISGRRSGHGLLIDRGKEPTVLLLPVAGDRPRGKDSNCPCRGGAGLTPGDKIITGESHRMARPCLHFSLRDRDDTTSTVVECFEHANYIGAR